MDEATAKQIAGNSRQAHDVPAACVLHGVERRIIEIADGPAGVGNSGAGVLVRDVFVWIVRFQAGVAWAELAVDEATGTVVRVQRSRSR